MQQENKLSSGIDYAVEKAGSQLDLARSIGVSQQAISQWQKRGYVPAQRAVAIAGIYGVRAIDLMHPLIRCVANAQTQSP